MNILRCFKNNHNSNDGYMMNSFRNLQKNIFKSTFTVSCIFVFFFTFFSGKVDAQNYSTLCNSGMILEKNGDINAAINKYSDAISIKPNSWRAYSYRANAYYSIANYDNALSDISQAIILSPNDASLYEIRGNCYLAKEVYDKALADLNMVLSTANKNDTKYFFTFFHRGKALYYNKRYDDAIVDFTQSLKLGKNNPQDVTNIYYWRGVSYMELNRFQDAVRDFDSYLFVNPNDVKAIFYQGLSYNKSGDTEKAKANALKMVDIDPAKEVYFSNEHLLDIYDLEMRRKVAKQSLEDATKNIKEYKSSSSKTLGNIKLAQAFAKLDKAWLYSSGIKNEDRDLGDTILKRIFEVYPQMTEKPELPELARKYMVQASTATEEKNYVPALILWNKAINIAPYYPLSYFNRALLKEILNDYKGAITDVKKYLELSPDASNARAAQDKIYEWEGKSRNSSTTITTSTLPGSVMQNKPVSSNASTAKPKFIFRTGLNIPKGVFAKAPDNIKDSAFLKSGNMGAKAGPFFEIGLGLAFSKEASKVQFYYNPLIASYATNQMSWGNSLATDTNRSIKIIEIAQRYGVAFKPTQKLLMAIFYRPAGVIPLNFKASVNGSQADGTMSTKMVFMMSHTFGFTVAYSFISLSFEMYYAHPTFDVTIPNSTNTGTVNVNAVKIPFRTNRIGIAFTF